MYRYNKPMSIQPLSKHAQEISMLHNVATMVMNIKKKMRD
jgi:hypothetical protein